MTLAILAGGKGKRLGGAAKGLISVAGKTILERQLELAPQFAEVMLVGGDASPYREVLARHPAVRVVPDAVPGKGAPGGVHAALAVARTGWVVAIACDMPFISAKVLEVLLSGRSPEVDAVAFEVGGRLQPLPGAYRASLAGAWERQLASDPPLRLLFSRFRPRALPAAELLRKVDPPLRALESVNEPKDLERLGARLPAGPGRR